MRLREKIAIVTGAADGIGLAISQAFGREGAQLIMADIQDKKCDAEATEISNQGPGKAIAAHCDVTQTVEVEALVAMAMRKFGRVDILVNNAAIAVGGPVTEMLTINGRRCWIQI